MSNVKEVKPIKDAQFTFLNFLWKEMGIIREYQRKGFHYDALIHATNLVDYLPNDFQTTLKFQEKAKKIIGEANKVVSHSSSFARRSINTIVQRNLKAMSLLKTFMADLCLNLDKKGYMEKKGPNIEYGSE